MVLIVSILYLVIIAENLSGTYATNYCNMESCEKNNDHTMCKYPSSTPGKSCLQYNNLGFNNVERQAIVKKHNELRQKVASGQEKRGNPGPQPKAVKMSNLTWDKELETIAQRWANQCDFNHDGYRDVGE
ncbi:venom allergen 3 [Monomorium pharaonis]|uniref:venom allergen 3 n=1 Tax=Monomorium pharaonis TaxID=307658 RepID=UPI00063F00FB|nr:venom allergen 3 [Monomorium pharaonis]